MTCSFVTFLVKRPTCNFVGLGVGLLLRLRDGDEAVLDEVFFFASRLEVPRRADPEDDDPDDDDELDREDARLVLLDELDELPELDELLLDEELALELPPELEDALLRL